MFTLIFITLILSLTKFSYSAFTANATITSQIFSTEKIFTKEQLVQEIPNAVTDDLNLLANMFDSSLSDFIDSDSLVSSLQSSGESIATLKQISEIRQEDGNWAEVDFEVTYDNETKKEYTAILHYEYGTWKLFGTIEI